MGRGEEKLGLLAREERRGLINTIVLGVSFCILFVAFSSTQNLQTNLNGKLGYWSLSVLYMVFAPANFISPYIVLLVGEKVSLLIGAACYCVYIAANIVVTEPTLLGASAIIGFGAAILWTAQGSVVIHSAPADKLGVYNGLFFGIFQWAQVIGNLLAGVLISKGTNNKVLFLILTVVGSSSLLLFLLVKGHKVSDTKSEPVPVSVRLGQTFKIMGTRPMVLLYLAMIYSGVTQSYFFGVFPESRPKDQVGYIMAVFGAADVIGSFLAGYVSDKVGRLPIVFTCAVSMSFGSTIFFLQDLNFLPHDTYLSYVIAILLGIADSGFNTQIYATLGTVFSDRVEAAIGAFKFFQAGSSALMFFVGPYVSHTFWFVVANSTLWSGTLTYFALDAMTSSRPESYRRINALDVDTPPTA